MTQQEIEELIYIHKFDLENCDDPETTRLLNNVIVALYRLERLEKRNAILEAAIAWHGWDEVPEKSGVVDLKCNTGAIVHTYGFRSDKNQFYNGFNFELFNADEMIRKGFIGWRYPVGDLSE